ncbi:MAG TPA: hypothetical protein PLG60_08165 [Acidimicrobiales bacterium]|nr:hypothetical protein [Acidimicrobiales bacterium]
MVKLKTQPIFPVLNEVEKMALASSGEPINIKSVRWVVSQKFGPWWAVVFVSATYPQPHTLGFHNNAFRETFFADIQEQLTQAQGEDLEAIVIMFKASNGHNAYTLAGDEPEDDGVMSEEADEVPF